MAGSSKSSKVDEKEVRRAELAVVDKVGLMMEFWGFKRAMGRIWTLLFLSPEPITAAEIGERLAMSAGAVSMTLGELVKWGAVKKTWRPGDRRDYFECETSIWKLVTRVMRERELALIKDANETFAEADQLVGHASAHGGDDGPDEVTRLRMRFLKDRIGQLKSLADLGERLLGAIVAGETVDPAPLREASARLRKLDE